jgi:hypothetical protein
VSAAQSKTVTLPIGHIILIETVLNARYEHLIDQLGDCNNSAVKAEIETEAQAIGFVLTTLGEL